MRRWRVLLGRVKKDLAGIRFDSREQENLNNLVYNLLREAIISGRLSPGQVVSTRALAEVIEVSPMPVRGALQRLVAEGAIELRANRTFALPVLNYESFKEIATLRSNLEGLAVELAVPHLSLKDARELAEINHSMFQDPPPEWASYLELNRRFHFRIYTASKMPQLVRFIESLWLQIGPLLNLVASREEMSTGRETHEAMVIAIAQNEPDVAREIIQREIQGSARVIGARLLSEDLSADTGKRGKEADFNLTKSPAPIS
ncbi:transcriptional regulator [Mesorhizobium amorphae]|nr:transcriptional regulator [Mesorhizobium amorphae]